MTMLHAGPLIRKKMTKEVEILDGEMQSRYDKIHGHLRHATEDERIRAENANLRNKHQQSQRSTEKVSADNAELRQKLRHF